MADRLGDLLTSGRDLMRWPRSGKDIPLQRMADLFHLSQGSSEGKNETFVTNNFGLVIVDGNRQVCTTIEHEKEAQWLTQLETKSDSEPMTRFIASCGVLTISGENYRILLHGGDAEDLQMLSDLTLSLPALQKRMQASPPKKVGFYYNPRSAGPEKDKYLQLVEKLSRDLSQDIKIITVGLNDEIRVKTSDP